MPYEPWLAFSIALAEKTGDATGALALAVLGAAWQADVAQLAAEDMDRPPWWRRLGL